ncbi:MAG: ribonuclease HI family protein [Ktedonobacterales bacterium]
MAGTDLVLILRTDGASRGNPGPAAAGVVIESPSGDLIAYGKKYLGIMTNNQAEYQALILGLRALARYRPAEVQVRMDSELVVRQMTGVYRVKDDALRPLYEEARMLVRQLPVVTFQHVMRSQNSRSDSLANEALDQEAKRSKS